MEKIQISLLLIVTAPILLLCSSRQTVRSVCRIYSHLGCPSSTSRRILLRICVSNNGKCAIYFTFAVAMKIAILSRRTHLTMHVSGTKRCADTFCEQTKMYNSFDLTSFWPSQKRTKRYYNKD